MSDVLFQITQEQLETGLRGYPCGYCTTSYVDPQKGLFYVGKPLTELVDRDPEEVMSLLYFGKEASFQEKTTFMQQLQMQASLSPTTVKAIEKLPREGHPMKLLSAAVLIVGMLEGKGDYRKDCISLMAKMPHLVAAVINYHAGWGATPPPQKERGYMENFAHQLLVPGGDTERLAAVFRLFNILHYDHGGGNLSAFVGKAVASGLEDLYGSISAALSALAGPRHGKANQDCLQFVQEVLQKVGPDATEGQVEQLIRDKLDRGELVFGFGHAVLRVEDPRATVLYDYAQKHYPSHPLVKVAMHLRSAGPKVLAENPKISNPYPNIDAISGVVLSAAGFDYPHYFTALFGLARSIGISIQIVYERLEARGGKGTPIVRPKYLYKSRL